MTLPVAVATPSGSLPATSALTDDPAVARVIRFFEHLQPGDVVRMSEIYAPQARFKDPFNDVVGTEAIAAVFHHMFASLHEPRFVVTQAVVQGQQAFLTWAFHFRFQRFSPGRAQVIQGGSHLVFDAQGRVTLHRDYWDAAEELYEKLPVVGALMRWLRRQANR